MQDLNQQAQHILAQFPIATGWSKIIPQGNRGGFSGAGLWQVVTTKGDLCLRAWPVAGMTAARLAEIHQLMSKARHAGLTFVPSLLPRQSGATWAEAEDRLWELTTWMPGQADFHDQPSVKRIEAAVVALARLHSVWASMSSTTGQCPGIHRRLQAAREWQTLMQSGWRPAFTSASADPVQPLAERAWRCLKNSGDRIIDQLTPWTARTFLLHPCLCDIWHDHVLFEGDTVTGVVDYGGVKLDHVAVDLARLLGSMAGDDPQLRTAALKAYWSLRPISLEEEGLITVLDQTGTLVGAMTWLKWLYLEGKHFEDRAAAAKKLTELVTRIESWA